MRSIVFNVKPGIGRDEQASLLTRLGALPGVERAAALSPNSKSQVTQRMCYAYVNDAADVETVRGQIACQPEIESADLPAERGLT
jgi:hypothetical protein